ncbi:MAG TPA: hypothetical protein VK983_03695, partial [Candidatus Limnocylindrales bacterium]|nr:hypothetical protein [Candidatus Limnocylindrales bacterium]
MKSVNQRLKSCAAIAAAVLILGASLLPLFEATTYALPAFDGADTGPVNNYAELTSIADKATFWTSYKAALTDDCILKHQLSGADISSGNWFLSGGSTRVGHHVEPDDGKAGCNNENGWFSDMMAKAGYANLNEAAAIILNSDGSRPNDWQARLKSAIDSRAFQGSSPGKSTDDVTYYILFKNFTAERACNAAPTPAVSSDPNKVPIQVYDPETKTVSAQPYSYPEDKDITIGRGTPLSSDGRYRCREIAAALGKAQYANAAKTTAAAGTSFESTGANTAGEDPSLQCGTLRNILNWIICPVIKLINAAVGGIDNLINSLLSVDQEKIFNRTTSTGLGYYN